MSVSRQECEVLGVSDKRNAEEGGGRTEDIYLIEYYGAEATPTGEELRMLRINFFFAICFLTCPFPLQFLCNYIRLPLFYAKSRFFYLKVSAAIRLCVLFSRMTLVYKYFDFYQGQLSLYYSH